MTEPHRSDVEAIGATGPLSTLDAAFSIVRQGGLPPVGRALVVSAPLAFCALAYYFTEFVEGITVLRLPFAMLFVVAWGIRVVGLGRVSRAYVLRAWPFLELDPAAGGVLTVLRTQAYSALFLSGWLVLFAVSSWIGAVGLASLAPLTAIRAFWTPSGLVSAACSKRGGFSGFVQMVRDGVDRRSFAVLTELWLVLGTELLAVNVFLMLALSAMLMRSMLGLDVTVVEMFFSLSNDFLVVLVVVLAVWLMEPLRAAVNAVHYLDVRVRRPGLDLQRAVEALSTPSLRALLMMAAVLMMALMPAHSVLGQASADPNTTVSEPTNPSASAQLLTTADQATAKRVREVLAQDIFRDERRQRDLDLTDQISEFFRWLFGDWEANEPQFELSETGPQFSPPPEIFMVLAGLILIPLLAWAFFSLLRPRREPVAGEASAEDEVSPLALPAEVHLDQAARLFAAGRHREALRSLYLATLVAFDRQGVVPFDPARTNGQTVYLLPAGQLRDQFRAFTQLFDSKWYGQEATLEADYRASRKLAEAIAQVLSERPAAEARAAAAPVFPGRNLERPGS